ncbi:26S proteasome non-ATPase regulatory subunit 8 homolog A-like isoform X3 [Solanum dulcamara]|nr:26S proteasome non-ATPase regulatory subunit 8 homolog A-like isoform X3 [Solanum dulcamara]
MHRVKPLLFNGVNLSRKDEPIEVLTAKNRIAEFHTEHELLSPSALDNACIKHAVELEQSFMAGANHRVLSARETVHDATYAYFMDLLAKTVRFFGMAINNVPWNQKVPRP